MADIRPKDLLPAAATPADDDYLLLDGATEGTRKILADALTSYEPEAASNTVERQLADKANEFPTPDDYTNYGALLSSADQWLFPGAGEITSSEPFNLVSNRSIIGGRFLNETEYQLFQQSANKLLMFGTHILEGVGSNMAIQISGSVEGSNYIFSHLDIEADGYPLLVNPPANGKNMIVANSHLKSEKADGVQINTYDGNFENVIILGNTLKGGPDAPTFAGGFGVGLAGCSYAAVVANVAYDCGTDAYHLEDQSKGAVFVGNVASRCKRNGLMVLRRLSLSNSITDPNDGTSLVGNHMEAIDEDHSLKTDNDSNGLYHVYDENGSHSVCSFIGNRARYFKNGIYIGEGVQAVVGNAAMDCDVALRMIARDGIAEGTTIARDCPTLMKAESGAWTSRVAYEGAPTTILDVVGKTWDLPSGMTQGFAFVDMAASLAHTGDGSLAWYDLFDAADFMEGRLTVSATQGTAGLNLFAGIHYDGTVFEVKFLQTAGKFLYNIQLRLNAGKVQVGFEAYSALTVNKVKVDFQGAYFKWPSDATDVTKASSYATATTTQLGDVAHAINTTGKRLGRRVYNTTNDKFLIAAGSATTDQWIYEDASTPITPS